MPRLTTPLYVLTPKQPEASLPVIQQKKMTRRRWVKLALVCFIVMVAYFRFNRF